MNNSYSLGNPRDIIRSLRAQRGFASDRALAIAAGINQPTLSRYLAGTTDTMDLANFQAIAGVLEVTLSELLGEVPMSNGGQLREWTSILQQLPDNERAALLAAGRAMAANATSKKP